MFLDSSDVIRLCTDSHHLAVHVLDVLCESVRNEELSELQYVDDLGILAETEEELQGRMVEWQEALERKCIKVNAKKTEVIVCPREDRVEADI